ncbi:putative membrane protein YkoI [Virgibacillus halotolerans]|uniref:PepSY domain-containing protein n=1 Tax=Virgibacillus halotolerans TaxID=1071053 RepID=UPI001EF7C09F|nr:PepSY domain-containing protein [Virgibacillus halotolerans]MBM7600287.1 putative membrane protein YkoI [Virgibacillus halotolerans]
MHRNWNHQNPYQQQRNPYQQQPNPYQEQPNPYQEQPNPYHQQPEWQQDQGWNNPMNYDNGQHFHRQITIEEAMNIALEQVPGQVVKVEMDTEKGVRVYEVDIVTAQGVKYEVAVNMNTGEIVEIELD